MLSQDKEFYEYEGAHHDLYYEHTFKIMFTRTLNWLNKKLSQNNTK
jgi:alpha-beta hydrolase superfamily lysophospholipase